MWGMSGLVPLNAAEPGLEQTRDQSRANFIELAHAILLDDKQESAAREKLTKLALDEQEKRLLDLSVRLKRAEQTKQQLKITFDRNETLISELNSKLELSSGTLGEVFGVANEGALELIPTLKDSITSAEYPQRVEKLKFAETTQVPTISDFRNIFLALESEIAQSGQLAVFSVSVIQQDGTEVMQRVLRLGTFGAVNEQGNYLKWNVEHQKFGVLPTQPAHNFSELPNISATEPNSFLIDPTRGDLFALLDREPSFQERIEQGGTIGYIIISLGCIGLVIGLLQLIMLLSAEMGVRRQLKASVISQSNPLGRVLYSVKEKDIESKVETLELKVDEAVMAEFALLERGQSFLKLLAAVAPLLGLLGTVIGMIATFQSISIFGTSDPKLMASGISQALMTTVLGLVVAVPILFVHSVLVSRSRRIVQILQQKSFAALGSINQSPELKLA
jgi:biopolymer transport protein ExbB